jgi:uncharacterized membrane protein
VDVKVRKIVVAGVMGAISIFLGATHLGFIPWFAGAALTVMHVPVIIGAVLEGPIAGAVIGLIFGAFSLIQGAIAPTGPADVWFVNPLVSIVPRLCIGPVAWLVFRGSEKLKEGQIFIISGFIGVVVNTLIWLLAKKYGGFDSDIIIFFDNIKKTVNCFPTPYQPLLVQSPIPLLFLHHLGFINSFPGSLSGQLLCLTVFLKQS